ncbi:DUF389 domain-containing protein [Nakamurella flavida]|uniref:DUF389 domain-containing protein n=1 Tax=Nakamurella flavida TaxID=363630 RepID=A0A938YGQ8_9ACTN|nr:DUF389 domain-containing protein [Nakamurella flavida]MBM9477381.1 DUF389 domain-containing protein [Nakamurella flavida]MDP9777313.1 putative hydrophobic protein (TIGR00271 family) [Nakamurella flavida]
MLHLRLLVPAALSTEVIALLEGWTGLAHLSVVTGASRLPLGDLVEADVVRECADDLIGELVALGLDRDGSIAVDATELSVSTRAERAAVQAPGNATDAMVWRDLEARVGQDAELTGTFLTFLTIATLLAGIGIVTDSAITIVGAMVLGPEFGPLAAIAVGLVRRRPALMRRGVVSLLIGFALAMAVTAAAAFVAVRTEVFFPELVDLNIETEFIYEPGFLSFVVAVLAGAAGMLSLTSRQSTALVGVFISVTTVPAAGYVAVGLVLDEWDKVAGSAAQLGINVVGIVASAVTMLLLRRAVRRRSIRRAAVRAA